MRAGIAENIGTRMTDLYLARSARAGAVVGDVADAGSTR
jgi:hypothetical protein